MPLSGNFDQYSNGIQRAAPAATGGYAPPPRPTSDRAPMENSPTARPITQPGSTNPNSPWNMDALNGYRGALMGYYQPSLDLLNNSSGRLTDRSNYMGGYYNSQEGFATRNYQNDLAQLGLRRADLGIDRGVGESLLGNLQRAMGLNNQGLSESLANIDRRLQTDTASQAMDWRDRIQQLSSARIAGGFGTAPGYDIGGRQINEANANQMQALNNAALYARQQANLDNAQSNLGIENSQIRQRGELSKLDNAFAATGLQGDALKIALDQKLAELGLSRFTNAQQLAEGLESNDAQKRQIFESLAGQLAVQNGMDPNATRIG